MFTPDLSTVINLPLERRTRLIGGLRLLEEARADAVASGLDVWQFAVKRDELLAGGLTSSDLRLLMVWGVVSHAYERSRPESILRVFVPSANMMLADESAFVLAPAQLRRPTTVARDRIDSIAVPSWDAARRELRWAGSLVKQFRVPAPSQEAILSAFEEEGWPARIDDPLPRSADRDPHQRLHDAVRGLNRNQNGANIGFYRDGTGEGVCWTKR